MRAAIVVVLMFASIAAHADVGKQKCKDPKNYVFNPSSGCIKRPPVRPKSPSENYVNALDALDTDVKKAFGLFESACTSKYAQACFQLGRLYHSGRDRVVRKDEKKAFELYEKGCALGDGAACQKRGDEARKAGVQSEARGWFAKGCNLDDGNACAYLALMLDKGYGGEKNEAEAKVKYDKAHALMEKLCPGNGLACFMRGYFLENGLGTKVDQAKALEAYRKGCDSSFGDSCWKAAKILEHDGDDKKNSNDITQLFERSCELENADGCSQAAGRLSDADPKATHPVELAERGCNLDTKECGMLAQMYRLGRGMAKPDQAKATQIFKSTCDAGDHWICVTYAQRLHDGTGTTGDKPELANAEKVLEAACKEDEETACLKLSNWTLDAKTDDPKAFRFAQRACALKSPRGCFLAAWMVRNDRRGGGGGMSSDPKTKLAEAQALAETGCDLGSGNACNEAGEIYEAQEDPTKAREKFVAGCAATDDQHGDACSYAARYLYLGLGGAKDKKGAHKAAIRACIFTAEKCVYVQSTADDAEDIKLVETELGPLCDGGGNWPTCIAVGQTFFKGTSDQKRRGREALGNACRKGKNTQACLSEADAIYNGLGGDADHAAAEKLFRTYCDDKDRDSCFQIAFYHRTDDGAVTREFAEKACDLGHAEGCNLAGFVHYTAMKPVKWDVAKAVTYYDKACELGSSSACGNIGEVYRFGLGARIDLKKAHELYKKGCDRGSQYSCGGYAHFLATGEGGAKVDKAEAEKLYRAACEAETLESCSELATLLEKTNKGTLAEIAKFRLRAFQLAEDQSKTNPEYMYFLGTFHRDGISTMKDPEKALEAFGKACDQFDPFGCIAAGKMLVARSTGSDRERAKLYYQRACIAGVDDGCSGVKEAEARFVGPNPAVVHAKGCGCSGEAAPGGTAGGVMVVAAVLGSMRRRRRVVR